MDGLKIVLVFMTLITTCIPMSIDKLMLEALEVNETDGVISKSQRPSWNDYTIPGLNGSYVKLQIDMVMSMEEAEEAFPKREFSGSNRKKRSAVRDKSKLWPLRIPYMIDDQFSDSQELLIMQAMQQWMQFTCLEFVPKQPKDFACIKFESNEFRGCVSFVGMINMHQAIYLSAKCLHPSILIHEIGHVLGLYHEQSRPDRDEYVTIKYENVEEDKEMQFDKVDGSVYDNYTKPYDYTSIMHYSKDAFSNTSKTGLLTIVPKDITFLDKMGEGHTLSFLDAKIVNAMYQCSKGCMKKVCPQNGFLGKHCECYCPGPKGEEPVQLCTHQVYCGKPLIDQTLYQVFDASEIEQINYLEKDFFNGTKLYVEFLDFNLCGVNQGEFTCLNGDWKGELPLCESESCVVPEDWKTLDDDNIEGGTVIHGTNLSISCPGRNGRNILMCNDSLFLDVETDTAFDVNSHKCKASKTHYHVIKDEGRSCQVAYKKDVKYTIRLDGERQGDGDYVSHMSSVEASCDDPDIKKEFDEFGLETTMVCKDGEWDGFPLTKCPRAKKLCSLVVHALISGPLHSSARDKEQFEERYNVTCIEGYTLNVKDPISRCTFDGAWTSKTPECTPYSCKIPNDYPDKLFNDAGINLIKGMEVSHNDHATLKCARGEVADADKVLCHLGNWETETEKLPICRKVVCPVKKGAPFVGFKIKQTKEYVYSDVVQISRCPSDLELKGSNRVTCQRDGTWSGQLVCRKFCKKGKTRFKKWPGKLLTIKTGKQKRFGSFSVAKCLRECKKEKEFLCKTVSYGFDPRYGLMCRWYKETIEGDSNILEDNISWEVAQRICT